MNTDAKTLLKMTAICIHATDGVFVSMLEGLTQEQEQCCIVEDTAKIIENAMNWMPTIIAAVFRMK